MNDATQHQQVNGRCHHYVKQLSLFLNHAGLIESVTRSWNQRRLATLVPYNNYSEDRNSGDRLGLLFLFPSKFDG
jgi:hypothetical protein